MDDGESLVSMNGTHVSFIGNDCENIPDFLGDTYGQMAKRLDLSFNLLSAHRGRLTTSLGERRACHARSASYRLPRTPPPRRLAASTPRINASHQRLATAHGSPPRELPVVARG
ncbi:unnamed protein product [Gadus morhua 'NCC']